MTRTGHDQYLEAFTRERHALEGYILAIVRNPHLAEDVYQDTAVEVLKNLHAYDTTLPFRNWVLGIARNKAKQALTKSARLTPVPQDRLAELVETAYAEQTDSDWETLSGFHLFLRACLNELSTAIRQMVHLRYFENLSAKLVGERIGKSAGAVDVALSRAREALAACIQKRQNRDLADSGPAAHGRPAL